MGTVEERFRNAYTTKIYPVARVVGWVLVTCGLVLPLALRALLQLEVETRSLVWAMQAGLVACGALLLLSRRFLTLNRAVLALSILLVFVGLETVLRIESSRRRFYRTDPQIEVGHRPDARGTWEGRAGGREFSVEVQINRHGFPDVERELDKGDAFRVAMLGDSFVEAFQVQRSENLVQQLERRLNERLRGRFEVLNFGTATYGTGHERRMLEHRSLRWDPDLVVVLFVPQNDLHDNLRRYRLVDGRIEELPVSQAVRKLRLRRIYPKSIDFLHDGLRDIFFSVAERVDGDFHHQHAAYYDAYRAVSDGELDGLWRIQRHAMADLVRVAGGIPVLFVAAACNEQVDARVWEAVQRRYPSLRGAEYDLARPNRLLIQACTEIGSQCLDLLPPFRAHRGGPLHHFYDGHFNAAGHDLAAEVIYGKLVETGLVP